MDGHANAQDQLSGLERGFDLGRCSRFAVKFLDGNGALAVPAKHVDLGIKGNESNRPVAGINGDASLAST